MIRPTSARFVVPVDLYCRDLYVSLGETDDRLKQGLLRYKPEAWVDDCVKNLQCRPETGVARTGRLNSFILLRLGVFPRTNDDYGTLQHEIFHAVEMMMDDVGMPHSLIYSSEAYAYLVGWLTRNIYEFIWTELKQ